ncbi:MAG: glycosyltransferase [Candidatus Saccharimonadales bacterium]
MTLFYNAFKEVLIYIPLSIIGIWRWSYWIVRRTSAALYRPEHTRWPDELYKRPHVSLVTPVYNEDPVVFEEAMRSWIANGVDEIIAVIDKANTRHIVDFERRYASINHGKTKCRLVVTPKPGKRAALCDGIVQAKGDIIALVDSDTIWDESVLEKSLPLFLNEQVGGATVGQRIQNPDNLSNVLFDLLLWTRYKEEVPFLLAMGKAFNTLSGRTALYRKDAILNPKYDNIHDLRHERFLGTRGVSGDDKRLTHLILEQGWLVQYAKGATVTTPGIGNLKAFMKQRLRWTRNSWRADLRAVTRGWVWQHPALAFFMIDRFFQPFIMLIGPMACLLAIIARDWLAVGILVAWWFFSRTVRLFGYFKKHPSRLRYLPGYILYTYANALLKIYALATLLEHSWATRWHKSRMRKTNWRKVITLSSGSLAVIAFVFVIYLFVNGIAHTTGANIKTPLAVQSSEFNQKLTFTTDSPLVPKLPANTVLPSGVKSYTVQQGDTLLSLSQRFQMSSTAIKKLNGFRDPDQISVGQVLLYYPVTTAGAAQ